MRRSLEKLSFFVLLVIVGLRPLVGEAYDAAAPQVAASAEAPQSPFPIRTLLFDLVILAAAAVTCLARKPGTRLPVTGLSIGFAVLALASVVSCVFAGQQRVAINGSIDWLCYPVLTLALAALTEDAWRKRLVIAVVLASACAQAAECFDQKYLSMPQTRAEYAKIRAELWARRGVELDSPEVRLFESRINADEATGYLNHGNVTGAYLAMAAVVAVAVLLSARGGSESAPANGSRAAMACATLGLLWATTLTGSLGALAALGIGAVFWSATTLGRRWINANRRRAWWLGCAIGVLAVIAVIGHGGYHGSLPGASLNFRWQYWVNSLGMVEDHGLTGVGRGDFGRHYLQYKPIETPEEVASPHNLFVQAATEWGMLGLLSIGAMIVGVTRRLCLVRSAPESPPDAPRRESWFWGLAIGGAIFLVRLRLLGSDNVSYLYVATAIPALAWVGGFFFFVSSPGTIHWLASEFKPVLRGGVMVALLVFFVQETINFGLFVPGAATTFFALLALVVAPRTEDPEVKPRVSLTPRAWGATCLVVIVVVTIVGVIPVARSNRNLHLARQASVFGAGPTVSRQPELVFFQRAQDADPLDPIPAAERARWLGGLARQVPAWSADALALASDAIDDAIDRDPWHAALHRRRARIALATAEMNGEADQYRRAIGAFERALELYPQDPNSMVALGEAQLAAGRALKREAWLAAAVTHLQGGLDLDDRRPDWEVHRRFSTRRREAVMALIAEAVTLMNE